MTADTEAREWEERTVRRGAAIDAITRLLAAAVAAVLVVGNILYYAGVIR